MYPRPVDAWGDDVELDPLTFALLVVDLVLLVVTVWLLLMARREAEARQRLLEEMKRTATILSRQEYFHSVMLGMQTARTSIQGLITGTSPAASQNADHVRLVVEQIRLAVQRGVTVRYLVPKATDRLALANVYRAQGAELRFHPGHLVSDVRYVIFDQRTIVIGLPAVTGVNEPTREGFALPSEGVAGVFVQQFDRDWAISVPYSTFLFDTVREIRSTGGPEVSDRLIAAQLQISEKELSESGSPGESRASGPPGP